MNITHRGTVSGRTMHPARHPEASIVVYDSMIQILNTMAETGEAHNAHIVLDEAGRRALIAALGGTP
jgi:hypothetical protein